MIKYSVLDEYKCSNCGEVVAVPQRALKEELSKAASVGACRHDFEKIKKEDTQNEESPAN